MRLSRKEPTQSFDDLPVDGVNYGPKVSELQPNPVTQKSTPPKAIIGAKITLKGVLTGEEDLLINGRVEGSINMNGHTVSIGEQGTVNSNIKAGSVVIEGNINGDVDAMDLITVKLGSNVKGKLAAGRVQLDDGAKFSGTIEMRE